MSDSEPEIIPIWEVTDEDIEKIREWARHMGPGARAAVQLLEEHDHWLKHEQFATRCVKRHGERAFIDFGEAGRLWREGTYGSAGQLTMLLIIADLGASRWELGTMDSREIDRVIGAVRTAAGQ